MDRSNNLLMKSKYRVQKHGEVFTPDWVVEKMLAIPEITEKTQDIFATFLEPSAGEGAFLLAIEEMKLSHVTDKYDKDSWSEYALWALSSIYGIELLEDNLEAARQNMLELFSDFYKEVYGVELSAKSDIYKSAKTIIWANIVQGDTLTRKDKDGNEITFSRWKPVDGSPGDVQRKVFSYSFLFGEEDLSNSGVQLSLFDQLNSNKQIPEPESYASTKIDFVWKEEKGQVKNKPTKFKFDVVIGNPPYQEETDSDSTRALPIYHKFMDEAYQIAERVSLITPARFLFNAGFTPKAWNEKMLNDKHLKVTYYEQDSSKVFSNTDIKGGVAVTYRDVNATFGPIETFTIYSNLKSILNKVAKSSSGSFSEVIYGQLIYQYTNKLAQDYPNQQGVTVQNGMYLFRTNAFDTFSSIFHDKKPDERNEYIRILGLQKNSRVYKWIKREYITQHASLQKYKVFLPKANGSGAFGESLSSPLIGVPMVGTTQTFLTIGSFNSKVEAEATLKYVCSKFARALLGVLKVTQDSTAEKWKYVPLQDFTPNSDIDWSKSVREIDRQLYMKYGLDEEEIAFIESKVKEME